MGASERILLVEDDTNWRDTLSRLLEAEGYEVKLAIEYGEAHFEILKAEASFTMFSLGLCVTDLRLASRTVEDNYDALGLLAECKIRSIPSIVVSGYLTRTMKDRLRDEYGVLTSFDKGSFSEQEFLAAVGQAFAPHGHNRMPTQIDLPKLRRNLVAYFNKGELRDLCFDLGVDYESLEEQTRKGMARELVAHCERHEHIDKLLTICRQLRPNVSW